MAFASVNGACKSGWEGRRPLQGIYIRAIYVQQLGWKGHCLNQTKQIDRASAQGRRGRAGQGGFVSDEG